MKLQDWRDVITRNFPEMGPITNQTVETTVKNAKRFRGSMRVSTGRIWTDADFMARRNRVRNTPLP